jgi:citryl-CoA synthetase large subunit
MQLFEAEAKRVLADHGVPIPDRDGEEYVVKAQVQTQNRKEHGGIEFADSAAAADRLASEMRDRTIDGYPVEDVLVEATVEHDEEYYVSFTYDTDVRGPVALFSTDGGSGVEDREVHERRLDGDEAYQFRELLRDAGVDSEEVTALASTLRRLYRTFRAEDALMLEVNPLVSNGEEYVALDAMMRLDDDADYRRDREFPPRSNFAREQTAAERAAAAIDENDHRGVAGKYVDLDGEIAMMLAGGGASLTNMDALVAAGGRPANYTEYGGNPPTEKVYELSKIVLDDPDLEGCWHVGGTANNTDVYRTMKGFCRALEEIEPSYPIVVRRDGPNADEGFELLRETRDRLGLDMELYRNDTPMTKTASRLMELVA